MSSLLMILGNLLALFAIFSMFGEAISGFELTMFDFAFGVKINEQDIIPQSMGVYSIFLVEIICVIISLYFFLRLIFNFIKYPHYAAVSYFNNHTVEPMVLSLFSLLATILSFCSLVLIKVDNNGITNLVHDLKLGVGPIAISVMNILSILCCVGSLIGIFYDKKISMIVNRLQKKNIAVEKETEATNEPLAQTNTALITEEEKIALLEKYHKLMVEKIITEEEFNNKKNQILK